MNDQPKIPTRPELKVLINTSQWALIGQLFGFEPKWTSFGGLQCFDWSCCTPEFWKVYQDVPDIKPYVPQKKPVKTNPVKILEAFRVPKPKSVRSTFKPKPSRVRTYAEQNSKCHYCGEHIEFYEWTIDHRIPISRNGSNHADNLVGCCHFCNGEKGNRTEKEYREWKKLEASNEPSQLCFRPEKAQPVYEPISDETIAKINEAQRRN